MPLFLIMENFIIRPAVPADSNAILSIYAPFITGTTVTFETEVPSQQQFNKRVRDILAAYPYLVCELNGQIIGYAYASPYHPRAAYRYTVDSSVYVAPQYHRMGVARALYKELFARLKSAGFYTVHVLIALPNEKSVGLHTALGFTTVGVSHCSGRKMGKWIDTIEMEYPLRTYDVPSEEHFT